MNVRRLLLAIVVSLCVVGAGASEQASALGPSQVTAFMGTWPLTMTNPAGAAIVNETPFYKGGKVPPGGEEGVEVSGRFCANSARILMKACLSGLGVALLPAMMISAEVRAGRLIHVLQGYRRDGADLNVVLPSRQHIPTAVSAFVEFAVLKLQSITDCEVEAASGSAHRRKARTA